MISEQDGGKHQTISDTFLQLVVNEVTAHALKANCKRSLGDLGMLDVLSSYEEVMQSKILV